jgi:hypothetical protein
MALKLGKSRVALDLELSEGFDSVGGLCTTHSSLVLLLKMIFRFFFASCQPMVILMIPMMIVVVLEVLGLVMMY